MTEQQATQTVTEQPTGAPQTEPVPDTFYEMFQRVRQPPATETEASPEAPKPTQDAPKEGARGEQPPEGSRPQDGIAAAPDGARIEPQQGHGSGGPQQGQGPRASRRLLDIQRRELELRQREKELERRQRELDEARSSIGPAGNPVGARQGTDGAERDGGSRQRSTQQSTVHEARQQHTQLTPDQIRRLARQDPERFLRDVGGIDERYVGEYFVNGRRLDPRTEVDLLREEMREEIERTRAEHRATVAEGERRRVEEQRERALGDWRGVAKGVLGSPEAQERYGLFLAATDDPIARVQDYITADFQRQLDAGAERPTLLSIEEAAEAFEADLRDHYERLHAAHERGRPRGGPTASPSGAIDTGTGTPSGGAGAREQGNASPDREFNALEALAARMIAEEQGRGDGQGAPETGVAIGRIHTQQVPDKDSDEELYRRALEELRHR